MLHFMQYLGCFIITLLLFRQDSFNRVGNYESLDLVVTNEGLYSYQHGIVELGYIHINLKLWN